MTYFVPDFGQTELRVLAHMIADAEATDQALSETMLEREVHLQAIDAFMDERANTAIECGILEGLWNTQRNTIRTLYQEKDMMAEGARIVGEELSQLRQENDGMTEVLLRNAEWMLGVREALSRLGITISTDELGTPRLSIDLPELSNSIESFLGIQG